MSEGQNLQDCDLLINYDIHWNPVRIIQRFGRIDRIGSAQRRRSSLINFWPTPDLNKYINLKNRVEARMALVDHRRHRRGQHPASQGPGGTDPGGLALPRQAAAPAEGRGAGPGGFQRDRWR
ncbi:MAG: SWF/SNF helicase family protein [Chromatiales bacterium]|nr:SWF/SNF helicase family protein [Chromatiales bacterium]